MRILFLLLLLASCQAEQQSSKMTSSDIISGEHVTQDQEPDLAASGVSIFMGSSSCSGVLISPNAILSAAHCFSQEANPSKINVYLGTSSPSSPKSQASEYEVDEVIPHPAYLLTNGEADLAIVTLKEAVPASYKPIQLHADSSVLFSGLPVEVSGFSSLSKPLRNSIYDLFTETSRGKYQASNYELVRKVMTKSLLIRNASLYGGQLSGALKDRLIIMQVAGGVCQGDSGGPTVVEFENTQYLIGINRAVFPLNDIRGADCESMSMITSVATHKDWIDETLERVGAEAATWSSPEPLMKKTELECSKQISESFDIYYTLGNPNPRFCSAVAMTDMKLELTQLDEACKTACDTLKGFKGQCEFLSRDMDKMIELNQERCSSL